MLSKKIILRLICFISLSLSLNHNDIKSSADAGAFAGVVGMFGLSYIIFKMVKAYTKKRDNQLISKNEADYVDGLEKIISKDPGLSSYWQETKNKINAGQTVNYKDINDFISKYPSNPAIMSEIKSYQSSKMKEYKMKSQNASESAVEDAYKPEERVEV